MQSQQEELNKPPLLLPELGYLLLEDCDVEVFGGENCRDEDAVAVDDTCWNNKSDGWIDVDILPFRSDPAAAAAAAAEPEEKPDDSLDHHYDDQHCETVCRRCNLVLERRSVDSCCNKEKILFVDGARIHPFHGTVTDLFCRHCSSAGIGSHKDDELHDRRNEKAKRSDASLLLGLLAACRDHVSVVRCRVLFNQNGHIHGAQRRATLLCTLAFPHLELEATSTTTRSILPLESFTTKRRASARRSTTKVLHPALQLLLQLVRSDWKYLQMAEQQLLQIAQQNDGSNSSGGNETYDNNSQQHRPQSSFFPTKLSLGDIYSHIQGSNVNNYEKIQAAQQQQRNNSDRSRLAALPLELLAEKVAPFFDAQSLAAVRSCNSFLCHSLRHIIPGLKVPLFSHQIHSVSWMRRREASLIRTERDCLEMDNDGGVDAAGATFLDSDIHRSVTGGATVRLELRRPCNDKKGNKDNDFDGNARVVIRLDSCTGHEIEPDTGSLPRQVARGGMLCDEPGLGSESVALRFFSIRIDVCDCRHLHFDLNRPNRECVHSLAHFADSGSFPRNADSGLIVRAAASWDVVTGLKASRPRAARNDRRQCNF